MLWRVIIPLRPETYENLSRLWSPLEADKFELGVLDFDELHDTREKLLRHEVSHSEVHAHMDRDKGAIKVYFDIITPEELATAMCEAWRAVTRLRDGKQEVISSEARKILDQLAYDSARRGIAIFARAGLSHCFMVRYRRSQIEGWEDPPLVRDFFLFNGLLCGVSSQFESEVEDLPIPNIFNVGAVPGSPHSIMIGPHSLYLLSQDQPWHTVRSELSRIGYDSSDIVSCEKRFINKEILKQLFNGEFTTKLPVVDGLWRLIRQVAYTDNMAVACAKAWNEPSVALVTNPLEPSQLVQRFSGSVALLKRVWQAERTIFTYSPHLASACGAYQEFSARISAMNLPSITHYIGLEYLSGIGKLPKYDAPAEAIKKDQMTWDTCRHDLEGLIDDSKCHTMLARQQQ
jgi:hypothetical protein